MVAHLYSFKAINATDVSVPYGSGEMSKLLFVLLVVSIATLLVQILPEAVFRAFDPRNWTWREGAYAWVVVIVSLLIMRTCRRIAE